MAIISKRNSGPPKDLPYYQVSAQDPDGRNRVFRVQRGIPIQCFHRGDWRIIIQRAQADPNHCMDVITWERRGQDQHVFQISV